MADAWYELKLFQSHVAFIFLSGIINVMAMTGTNRCLPGTKRAGGWCEPVGRRVESIPEPRAHKVRRLTAVILSQAEGYGLQAGWHRG